MNAIYYLTDTPAPKSYDDGVDAQVGGRPIHVCFMIDTLSSRSGEPAIGGTEAQLLSLIARLDRSKVTPYLCLLDGSHEASRSLEPNRCSVLRLGVRKICRPSTLVRAWQFARFLRRERIDILQVHFPDSTYFGVPVARLARVPYVVRARRNVGHWITPLDRRLGRLCTRFVDATVANCEACRRTVIEQERAAPDSVVVVPNGIDLERFANIPAVRAADNGRPRRVGMVANLRPVKAPDVFVRAAGILSRVYANVSFQIAGSGDEQSVRRLAGQVGVDDRLELMGQVGNVPAFLDSLDVAVLTSRAEGLSNALLEYMAAGRPIVATAVGGNVELIEDGTDGLLVPPDDPQAVADAIDRLLRNPGLAARLGAAARSRVVRENSLETMVHKFEVFCRGLKGPTPEVSKVPHPKLTDTARLVRHVLRDALMLVGLILTAPLWVPVRVSMAIGMSDDLFMTCAQTLSLLPGIIGVSLRRGFYFMCLDAFARDCSVGFGTWFAHPQVTIGTGVNIGGRCTLGTCQIGDHALIASNVDVLSGRHQHHDHDPTAPRRDQGGSYQSIRIGRNTWIGNSSVVMADIGDDSVVGAGSVVVKPIPPRSVAVGNPAAVKKPGA